MNDSRTGARLLLVTSLVAVSLVLGMSAPARADGGSWTLRLGLSYVDAGGHDPHVLTIGDFAGSRSLGLKTEAGPGFQLGLRYERGVKWHWGADYRSFVGGQKLTVPTAAADAGGAPVVYRITERSFESTGPDEVLYFRRLTDTDTSVWTADIYALRLLSDGSRGELRLLLGLRSADFDNDNRFAAGIEDVGGARIDASSNYSRMMGPLVGLVFEREMGKSRLELGLSLSAVYGDVELSSSLLDFTGMLVESENPDSPQRTFKDSKSVTIPIADLGAHWTYAVSDRFALVLGLEASYWVDVSVPPGVRPTGTLETLYESSLTYAGMSAAIELTF